MGAGTHAEHARTNSLERRFSAGSSGDAERRCCTEVEIAVKLRRDKSARQTRVGLTLHGLATRYKRGPFSILASAPPSFAEAPEDKPRCRGKRRGLFSAHLARFRHQPRPRMFSAPAARRRSCARRPCCPGRDSARPADTGRAAACAWRHPERTARDERSGGLPLSTHASITPSASIMNVPSPPEQWSTPGTMNSRTESLAARRRSPPARSRSSRWCSAPGSIRRSSRARAAACRRARRSP